MLLDFRDADVLTGSWISAMLVQLMHWGGSPEVELFFVLLNLDPELLDELRYVAGNANIARSSSQTARCRRREHSWSGT